MGQPSKPRAGGISSARFLLAESSPLLRSSPARAARDRAVAVQVRDLVGQRARVILPAEQIDADQALQAAVVTLRDEHRIEIFAAVAGALFESDISGDQRNDLLA